MYSDPPGTKRMALRVWKQHKDWVWHRCIRDVMEWIWDGCVRDGVTLRAGCDRESQSHG